MPIFVLKNQKYLLKVFNRFSKVLGLKPNTSKCEIAGIGGLNGVYVALCGMHSINLKKESLKKLVIHFSYYKKLEQEKKFECHIVKTEIFLKLWKMRDYNFQNIKKRNFFKKLLVISNMLHGD